MSSKILETLIVGAFFFATTACLAVTPNEVAFRASILKLRPAPPPVVLDTWVVNPKVLAVSGSLSFVDQVTRHEQNIKLLKGIDDSAGKAFKESHDADVVRDAGTLQSSLLPFTVAYGLASARANQLISAGYKLKAIPASKDAKAAAGIEPAAGSICNGPHCTDCDPIVCLFLIAAGALSDELDKKHPFGKDNALTIALKATVGFLQKPAGGDHSSFVIARNIFVSEKDNGDLGNIIKDPGRKTVQFLDDGLNALDKNNGLIGVAITKPGTLLKGVQPKDNSAISKAIRDPVKCTIGVLVHSC